MGDYVNRERVLDEYRMLEKLTGDSSTVGQAEERLIQSVIRIMYELPSAFDGMTNGEVLHAVISQLEPIVLSNETGAIYFDWDWWNAPYEKGGE